MKILHTSDWHLGRKLSTHDMHEHQESALDFLVDQAIESQVAAVLVSAMCLMAQFPMSTVCEF